MSGKNDDACGGEGGSTTSDALAPMRKWEGGMSSTGYASGPSHVDRADFGDDAADTPTEAGAGDGERAAAAGDTSTTPEGDGTPSDGDAG